MDYMAPINVTNHHHLTNDYNFFYNQAGGGQANPGAAAAAAAVNYASPYPYNQFSSSSPTTSSSTSTSPQPSNSSTSSSSSSSSSFNSAAGMVNFNQHHYNFHGGDQYAAHLNDYHVQTAPFVANQSMVYGMDQRQFAAYSAVPTSYHHHQAPAVYSNMASSAINLPMLTTGSMSSLPFLHRHENTSANSYSENGNSVVDELRSTIGNRKRKSSSSSSSSINISHAVIAGSKIAGDKSQKNARSKSASASKKTGVKCELDAENDYNNNIKVEGSLSAKDNAENSYQGAELKMLRRAAKRSCYEPPKDACYLAESNNLREYKSISPNQLAGPSTSFTSTTSSSSSTSKLASMAPSVSPAAAIK